MLKNRLIALTVAICMMCMVCLPASAASYYEYDNQMISIGLELTSALYLTHNGEDVSIEGITRVDAGSDPYYISFTMHSYIWYEAYTYPGAMSVYVADEYSTSSSVNNISPNTGVYIPKHGFTDAVSYALFASGKHESWVTAYVMDMDTGIVYEATILGPVEADGNDPTYSSYSMEAELELMMS